MALRPEPIALEDHALSNLTFIRATMERAGSFTAVPGLEGVCMGVSALLAACVAAARPDHFLGVWLAEACLAVAVGLFGMRRKARAMRVSLISGPARKFALGLAPPLVVGAALTAKLLALGGADLLPGLWLSLYGTGVVAGGAFSVRVVPLMGLAFVSTGLVAFFTPAEWGNAWLAVGFGGLQIVFGIVIGRRYGG